MPSRVINMLTKVNTAELSLVPNGANDKRIALTKESLMKFNELMKSVLETEAEGEAELITAMEKAGVSEDDQAAAVAQYRMANGFSDVVSKETFAFIAKAAGLDVEKAEHLDDDDDDDDDDGDDPKKKKKPFPGAAKPFGKELIAFIEKIAGPISKETKLGRRLAQLMDQKDITAAQLGSAAGISESTVGQILRGEIEVPPEERIRGFARALGVSADSLMGLLPKKEKDMKEYNDTDLDEIRKEYDEKLEKQAAKNEKLEKEVANIKRVALRKELIAECEKEYAHVPGKSVEEMADMLLKAREVGEDFEKDLREQWAATAETVKKSDLFTSAGMTQRGGGGGSAEAQLDKMAKEHQKASPEKVTFEKAYDEVIQDNPELYQKYLNEHPAQTQR